MARVRSTRCGHTSSAYATLRYVQPYAWLLADLPAWQVSDGATLECTSSLLPDSDRLWGLLPPSAQAQSPLVTVRVHNGGTITGLVLPAWCRLRLVVESHGSFVGRPGARYDNVELVLGPGARVSQMHIHDSLVVRRRSRDAWLQNMSMSLSCNLELDTAVVGGQDLLEALPRVDLAAAPERQPPAEEISSDVEGIPAEFIPFVSFQQMLRAAAASVFSANGLADNDPRLRQIEEQTARAYAQQREAEAQERKQKRQQDNPSACIKRRKALEGQTVRRRCPICCEAVTQVSAFVPCGHVVGCDTCSNRIYHDCEAKCSTCRATIREVLPLYDLTALADAEEQKSITSAEQSIVV
jgi:hypothetical protein